MLFDGGGLMVAEVARLHRVSLSGLLEQAALGLLAMAPVGMLVTALLLGALATGSPRDVRGVLGSAWAGIRPVAGLTLAQVFGVVAVLVLAYVLREGLASVLRSGMSPRAADSWSLLAWALGGAAAAAIVAVTDVARTTAVRDGTDAAEATVHAARVLVRRGWPLCTAFLSRGAASLFAITAAAASTAWLGMTDATRAVFALTIQHAALVAVACLRASWLARAMSLSARPSSGPGDLDVAAISDEGSDRSPRSGEPTDPSRDPGS